jgi:hypothetical protein
VLDYLADNHLIARAARLGRALGARLESLRRHRIVGDVRGRGMLWGIELVRDRKTREPFAPGLKVSRRVYETGLEEGILQVIGQSGGVDKVQGAKGMLIPADDPAEHIGLHKADDGLVGKHINLLMGEFQRLGVCIQADGLDGGGVRFIAQEVE